MQNGFAECYDSQFYAGSSIIPSLPASRKQFGTHTHLLKTLVRRQQNMKSVEKDDNWRAFQKKHKRRAKRTGEMETTTKKSLADFTEALKKNQC